MDNTVSVITTQLCHCCMKSAIDDAKSNGYSYVLIKLHLSKQVASGQAVVCRWQVAISCCKSAYVKLNPSSQWKKLTIQCRPESSRGAWELAVTGDSKIWYACEAFRSTVWQPVQRQILYCALPSHAADNSLLPPREKKCRLKHRQDGWAGIWTGEHLNRWTQC